jgi:NitT/TauT family transport system ATP-binding protein
MTTNSGIASLDLEGKSDLQAQSQDFGQEIIVFDQVSKAFDTPAGRLQATTNVCLSIREGEFITLVGPSGCGKSTLLNMVAGIFHPTTGSVKYRGSDVQGFNRKVGYMTQADHLLPWRDVRGNIAVPLELINTPKREIKATVEKLVELVGLKGFEKSYPSQLSGGMKKRTALARLLAYNPETLVFDEPFAALDAQLRLRMQIEIRRIARQLNKTILFVTHDLDEAVALADRCAIFSSRPGTIREILEVPLPRDRDLMRLRHDANYVRLTARLWDEMSPEIENAEGR